MKNAHLSREELIELCDRGVVPVANWTNRDSADAQRQLGEARALLAAGCDFEFVSNPAQTDETIWIEIEYPGFNAFEEGRHDREHWSTDLAYIPTAARLDRRDGKDWY